jgi:hypothetical protein
MFLNVSDKTPETAAQSAVAQGVQKNPSKASAAQSAVVKNAGARAAKHTANAASKTLPSATRQAVMRSVGLPADKLSASIISFARFFSLPLKPEVLKHIRQQAFTMMPNAGSSDPASDDSAPEARTVLKNREALSLAASAAEGKGVELQPKGLEAYARALDPESRQDNEHGGRRGRRKKSDDDNAPEVSSQKAASISAGSLEKTALEAAEKNPLLAILNRLPGKDGKRWIVLPFDFNDNGREFKVSLRILLETGKTVTRAACMALDIAIRSVTANGGTEPQPSPRGVEPEVRGSPLEPQPSPKGVEPEVRGSPLEKRRLFVFEPSNRLSIRLQPEIEPSQQTALVRELSTLLEIAPDRIFIETKTEPFPFEADCGEDLFGSINEAV